MTVRGTGTSTVRICILLMLALLAGCAGRPPVGRWQGPQAPAALSEQSWSYFSTPGKVVGTPSYLIFTTIDDEQVRQQIGQVMEGAMAEYRQMVPEVAPTTQPLRCFIFARRVEWADFTRRFTGADAVTYLQINRGGYAVRDLYVAYYLGDASTWSIASHEGWHQFISRNFRSRIPPFLEEGMACMFEAVAWEKNLPRWNVSLNPMRVQALRRALEGRRTVPLEQLVGMHAGDIVGKGPEAIDAFYGQSWAFAKFLYEADGGRYRPGMQRMLSDAAAGRSDNGFWHGNQAQNSAAVRARLEQYLQMPWSQIDRAYLAYIEQLAFQEFNSHWGL